ncbi:serine protease [Solimonas sp. SE-A11]|uniref:trypsin-like serine peptidase n=1 Tax=Solimonas sp. SE-A11 TaxID=3054954 RepID=UPI00259CCAD9|nr:trypsin-like peptidase domain-containing protein [Solimonas sp. SE-A11]MDM4772325.1 trypsin-like peptidase domain-containing protein [Solimonas sp. SE-A11]
MTLRRHALLPGMLMIGLLLSLPALATEAPPRHVLSIVQVQEATEDAKQDPLRYAVPQATDLRLSDGIWDQPAASQARWRLGIDSNGAESLSLRLEDLHLPAGSELRWIGEDSGDIQGPFGADSSGTLWLPLVRGSHALLELRLPAAEKGHASLRIAEAQHGYRAFNMPGTAKGYFNKQGSGACNIDVACTTANPWLSQVRSVVLLTIGNSAVCTGTLVDNVRRDGTPYVLTANHCRFDQQSSPSSIRAYFNVNRSGCGSGTEGSVGQNLAVAEVVSRSTTSDFALLRLLSSENGNSASDFNPYFAGWDASGTAPSSGAAIHHPSGDDKKISIYSSSPQKQADMEICDRSKNCFTVDAWKVSWNKGTTEAGSSGAALWNQDGQIVGTLSGGSARCDGDKPNTGSDYFGRLDLSWTGGDAKALGNSLKSALDPDNTGTISLVGRGGTNPAPSTVDPFTDTSGGGSGGGALPIFLLAALVGLGLLQRRR